jgi:gluconokinase
MLQPSPQHRAGLGAHLVVMGVSGAGKTAIATLLAAKLRYELADGDDFHPPDNVAKMARGEPLTDADRAPWLRALADWIANHDRAGRSTVLACSALKRSYRDTLRTAAPQRVLFIHLAAANEVLLQRLTQRRGHYMPPELLESQLEALEPLGPDELGMTLDAAPAPEEIVDRIVARLTAR